MARAVSEGTLVNQTTIRLVRDDITDLDIEAFVFYAQNDLVLGPGFGNAITVRGGPTIQKDREALAPVETGDAVVSDAGNLKAKCIIHAVGPKFQEADTEAKLRKTMLSVLKRADERSIEHLAFPAMGAGYYGIPPATCAAVMIEALKEYLGSVTGIKEIVICVFDTPQSDAFRTALED